MLTEAAAVQPHMFQVWAWQAAAIGAMLSVIQLVFGVIKQSRESRTACAKFGYELLDKLFADEWASELLYAIDDVRVERRASSPPELGADFAALFRQPLTVLVSDDREARVYARLDALLYFLDRFEHAIKSELTTFDTLATPTRYYVKVLSVYRPALRRYIRDVGYTRVIDFLARFDEQWRVDTAE